MGMGGHPLLSFDTNSCDQLYGIDAGNETSLIQIPVGAYRARDWLKGLCVIRSTPAIGVLLKDLIYKKRNEYIFLHKRRV